MANPVLQPGHPLHMQRMHPIESPHVAPLPGDPAQGMNPQLQQVYRVASQPQLGARPPLGQPPIAPRPPRMVQRSVSQTQIPQARPRTIDLSPNTQPIPPQPLQQQQQHRQAYSSAMHQQMQQQQGPHPLHLQQAVMSGQPVPQVAQPGQQLPNQQSAPAQSPAYVPHVRAVSVVQMKSSPLAAPASVAQDRPSPLHLDAQVSQPNAGTPEPMSAVSINDRRRSMSAHTVTGQDRRMSVSPAMLAARTAGQDVQTTSIQADTPASGPALPLLPQQQVSGTMGINMSHQEPPMGRGSANAIL